MINWALKPTTDKPSIYTKKMGETFDRVAQDPQVNRTFDPQTYLGQYEDFANKFNAQVRGGITGAIEGAGDYISGLTSPFSIAATATGAAPFMRGAQTITSLGRIAPRAEQAISGIGPTANMIPEWVAMGAEDAYNAGRSIYQPLKTAEDVAYEVVKAGKDPIRSQIGGGFNLQKALESLNQARGK